MSIPIMNPATVPPIIKILAEPLLTPRLEKKKVLLLFFSLSTSSLRIRFILRSHVRLYFVLECGTGVVDESHEPVYPPDTGRTVCIGVIDDADDAALACPDGLVCRRNCAAMARHAKRPLCASVRPHDKGRCAHAGGEHRLEGNCFSGWIGHGELFCDVAFLHRDCAEIVGCFGRDERAHFRTRRRCAGDWSARGISPCEEQGDDENKSDGDDDCFCFH